MSDPVDLDLEPDMTCQICGAELEWVVCEACHGAGGFHDCGEDCCPCADSWEITDVCAECNGYEGYLACVMLPHSDEQMAAFHAKKGTP